MALGYFGEPQEVRDVLYLVWKKREVEYKDLEKKFGKEAAERLSKILAHDITKRSHPFLVVDKEKCTYRPSEALSKTIETWRKLI